MSREAECGWTEARQRAQVASLYLEVAELAEAEAGGGFRNVAAGNAVLAAIAATDALCCASLGRRNRSQDHRGATALLRKVAPNGARLARELDAVLAVKDMSHYGEQFVSPDKLKKTMRAATRLVRGAEALLDESPAEPT